MKIMKSLTALSLTLLASSAMAAVTVDPLTGTGFVGKGDVQLAFGWNNAQLQSNAKNVSFTLSSNATYLATCVWMTGEGTRGQKTHTITQTKSTALSSTINYELRKSNQITGFNLLGFGATTVIGTAPVVGGTCPGAGTDGAWTEVTQIGSSIGELAVKYDTFSVVLPY